MAMISDDAGSGVEYRINGTGRLGYSIFSVAMGLFTAGMLAIAVNNPSDWILWPIVAGSGWCTWSLTTDAFRDGWRITTRTWGFEAPDHGVVRISWSDVASYHHSNVSDSTEGLIVYFRPGAARQKPLSIDVTNLEPSVGDLLRTFDCAMKSAKSANQGAKGAWLGMSF
jgi:hypothetical protein